MKKILLWDQRQADGSPQRLEIDDALAAACVRAGVASAADPAEAGLLSSGGNLDAGPPVSVVLWSGIQKLAVRAILPAAVAMMAIQLGAAVSPNEQNVLQYPKLRIVGANGRTKSNLLATDATRNTFESRHYLYVGVDTPCIQISFDNWALDTSAEFIPPTALAIEGASLESDALALTRPLFFGASRATSIDPGRTAFSRLLWASDFGLPYFKRGTKYWVRLRGNVPVGTGRIPSGGTQYNPAGTYSSRFDPTQGSNAVSQVDGVGVLTSKTGQDSFAAPMNHTASMGIPLETRIPSLLGIGTSIGYGSNDDNTIQSGSGFINRAAFAADFTKPVPILNMARGSSTIGNAATLACRSIYFPYATVAIDEHGTNNIGDLGGGDYPALLANELTLWAALRSAGISKILKTRLIPRNTSSNQWIDLAGQINVPLFDSKATDFHAWQDAQLAAGSIDRIMPRVGSRDPGAYWKWPVNGTANYPTTDGVHPAPPLHAADGAELRDSLIEMYPQIAVA